LAGQEAQRALAAGEGIQRIQAELELAQIVDRRQQLAEESLRHGRHALTSLREAGEALAAHPTLEGGALDRLFSQVNGARLGILELGQVLAEDELHAADRAVAVFGHHDLGNVLAQRVAFVLIRPVDE